MGEVEADHRAPVTGQRRQALHVQNLAGEILHAGQQHEGELVPVGVDGLDQVLVVKRGLPRAGGDFHQRVLRIEAVEIQLGDDGIAIRGEGRPLDQDLSAPAPRPVEADHQQMEVDGEAVHAHHLALPGAGERGQGGGKSLVVVLPRPASPGVAFDRELAPVLEFLVDELGGRSGLKPQGVSAQVDALAAVVGRDEEPVPEAGQGVRGVHADGVHRAGSTGQSTGREGAASLDQAATCRDRA